MKFTWDINLGTLVEIGVFVITLLGGIRRIGQLETKLNIMYDWFEQQVINNNGRSKRAHAGD